MSGVRESDDGIVVGALMTLEEIAESPLLAPYHSVRDVIDGIAKLLDGGQGSQAPVTV